MAQPKITTRFSNPQYEASTKKLTLNVDFLSDTPDQRIYGMNVRFFYDGAIFEKGNTATVRFKDYAPGYGGFSPNPPYFGNSTAGIAWFKLSSTAVTYVNGAMALTNVNATPIIISTDILDWTTLFKIELTTKLPLTGEVAPAIIWDKETIPTNGGFIPGSDGVTITTILDPTGAIKTQPTEEYAQHFNWTPYLGNTVAPWGQPSNQNKFTV